MTANIPAAPRRKPARAVGERAVAAGGTEGMLAATGRRAPGRPCATTASALVTTGRLRSARPAPYRGRRAPAAPARPLPPRGVDGGPRAAHGLGARRRRHALGRRTRAAP